MSAVVPEPLTSIAATVGVIGSVITLILAAGKAIGFVTLSHGIISVGGVAIGTALVGGALAGIATALALAIVIGNYAADRCLQREGLRECVAGVIVRAVGSFASGLDTLFPFSAMHDRMDVLVKSEFWDVVEDGGAFVFCTVDFPRRRSELIRCYFFDEQVCAAADGAVKGAIIAVVPAIVAAAAVAAAIGCLATIILCLLVLLLAVLVAAVVVLVGAFIGGNIARAGSADDSPAATTGETLAVGDLVSVRGNMSRREHDNGANVLYWVFSANRHNMSVSPQPFSYCDINDELVMHSC